VTKRPGDDKFILSDGGNTRLRALKELYEETGVELFYQQKVDYTVFTSNSDLIIRHMVENEQRGDMIFFDRAKAAHQIKLAWLEENPDQKMSVRKLVEVCKEKGWSKISTKTASLYTYCVSFLEDSIPNCLGDSFGQPFGAPRVLKLLNRHTSIKVYSDFMSKSGLDTETALILWYEVLNKADKDPETFDLNQCWAKFASRLSSLLKAPLSEIETQLNHTLEHGEPYNGKVKYVEVGFEDATPKQNLNTPIDEVTSTPENKLAELAQTQQASLGDTAPEITEQKKAIATNPVTQTQENSDKTTQTDTPYRKLDASRLVVELHPMINNAKYLADYVAPEGLTPPYFSIREELLSDSQFEQTFQAMETTWEFNERYFYYRLLSMWFTYKVYITREYAAKELSEKNITNALARLTNLGPLEIYALNCPSIINKDQELTDVRDSIQRMKLVEYNFESLIQPITNQPMTT